MFWNWLLKYSSFFITGAVTFAGSWLLWRFTTRFPDLIYYTSHQQLVTLQPPQAQPGQPQPPAIGVLTFTLFLSNKGKAPARNVHVGHFLPAPPAHDVYPDIPRAVVNTPGGGSAIRFDVFPAKTLVTISYLYFGPLGAQNIISYVGSEEGAAKQIPAMLQRIWPQWWINVLRVLVILGLWVAVNAAWSLIRFLWLTYYLHR